MRLLVLAITLSCAACADDHALPTTSDSDPTWQLNKGRWELGVNDLTTAPDAPATPGRLPLPIPGSVSPPTGAMRQTTNEANTPVIGGGP